MNNAEIATRLSSRFYVAENGNVCFRDDNEADHETLLAMTFSASQAGISDDYAYSMVRDVLQLIADTEPDDLSDTDVSDLVDVYNADLMRFIASGTNWSFADDVKEEGYDPSDFMAWVGAAQDIAYRAALDAVISNWPEADDDDDDETA
jgi:hypothetical protein